MAWRNTDSNFNLAFAANTFSGGPGGMTQTCTYDPASGVVSQRTITNTNHDMFCPGLSIDATGRPVVTGGNNAEKTSIYDVNADAWISAANMQISRGYQSQATLSDGRIFTIGGSWSGGYVNLVVFFFLSSMRPPKFRIVYLEQMKNLSFQDM